MEWTTSLLSDGLTFKLKPLSIINIYPDALKPAQMLGAPLSSNSLEDRAQVSKRSVEACKVALKALR